MQRTAIHRHLQGGMATVLIMLLVGLSLTAAVLGVAYHINSTQAQSLATHAQTQAQMKAWTGAEAIRTYLLALQASGKQATLLAKTPPVALTLGGDGVTGLINASITAIDATAKTVTVEIQGATATGTRAEASSTLQVVYALSGSGGSASSQACGASPKASAVFKGDLSITGGTTSITSSSRYADIAVEGSLTLSNASQAIISGCTKDDISLSGGGIDDNATLSSQNGNITITSMSTPKNATLWAKAINIGNSGNGTYAALKAGAYTATVISSSNAVVGTARVGGRLLAATAGGGIPWVTGTVVPWTTGSLLVTLSDGSEVLVDLGSTTIDAATGYVSGATAASQQISGSTAVPDRFRLDSTAIFGGGVDIYTLTVGQTWGYHVTQQGYGGTYTEVRAAGDFKAVTGAIGTLTGGGLLWATAGGCSSSTNCWNFPTVTSGTIAGGIYYGGGKTSVGNSWSNVKGAQTTNSPGLPGTPFCDTRTESIDVTNYQSQANYIFYFENSKPKLTIQNVKNAAGTSIDRAGIDLSTVDSGSPVQNPTLRQIGGQDFLACNNQSASNLYSDALSCFRSATPSSGWTLNGITKFPPGVAWFQGPVTVDGVSSNQPTLYNTLLATARVTLTSAGHVPLVAPNLGPLATVCGGNFYPSNLCSRSGSTTAWATWMDSSGVSHSGLPLANLAIGTNGDLSSSGWTITGSVVVGGKLDTAGATTSITGSVTVGANRYETSDTTKVGSTKTTITAGGIAIRTDTLNADQNYLPSAQCTATSSPGGVKMLWSRYL